MDYLLSREKTSITRSNLVRARSVLVSCNISTDNSHIHLRMDKISVL